MSVSQPLGIPDRLRQQLSEAQDVLSNHPLRGKVLLEWERDQENRRAADDAMARTEADARGDNRNPGLDLGETAEALRRALADANGSQDGPDRSRVLGEVQEAVEGLKRAEEERRSTDMKATPPGTAQPPDPHADKPGSAIPGDSSSPGSADKLQDAILTLSKAMGKLPDDIQKAIRTASGRKRRGGKGGGGGGEGEGPAEPEGGEDDGEGKGKPGWVSPHLLQGLLRNPSGVLQSVVQGWFTNGSGTGIKAPASLLERMAGTSGGFAPGRALGAEVMSGGTFFGQAGAYASTGMLAGATVAVPIAAFMATMAAQMASAGDAQKDAASWVDDLRWGHGIGVDWRAGAWAERHRTRRDIFQKDTRELMSGSGVWWGSFGGDNTLDHPQNGGAAGMAILGGVVGGALYVGARANGAFDPNDRRAREQEKINRAQLAVNTAMNVGVDSSTMGSLVGAAVRSGTITLGGTEQERREYIALLNRIEAHTRRGADHGLSAAESLKSLSLVSQHAEHGAGLLTKENQVLALGIHEQILKSLPREMAHKADDVEGLLSQAPGSPLQKTQLMNQFVGAGGKLNSAGMKYARTILGDEQLKWFRERYEATSDMAIAQALVESDEGVKVARALMDADLRRRGVGGMQRDALVLPGATLQQATEAGRALPNLLRPVPGSGDNTEPPAIKTPTDSQGGTAQLTLDLAKMEQGMQRLSSVSEESALALQKLKSDVGSLSARIIETADHLRQLNFRLASDSFFGKSRP